MHYCDRCSRVVLYLSVCHAPTLCKTAEWIGVQFVVEIILGPRNILLHGDPDPPYGEEEGGDAMRPSQFTLASRK